MIVSLLIHSLQFNPCRLCAVVIAIARAMYFPYILQMNRTHHLNVMVRAILLDESNDGSILAEIQKKRNIRGTK